MKTHN